MYKKEGVELKSEYNKFLFLKFQRQWSVTGYGMSILGNVQSSAGSSPAKPDVTLQ